MVRGLVKKALFIVAFIIVFVVTILSQHKLLKKVRQYEVYRDSLYLPRPEYIKVSALGYDMILADLLWLRSIQAFGGHFMSDKDYSLMYNLFDVITDLDPHFIDAYRFGNMVVGEGTSMGKLGQKTKSEQAQLEQMELGLKLLEKGMKNNPNKYRLPFEAGYVSWWNMKDAKRAKQYYKVASKCPDAPDWIERQLAYFDLALGKYNAAFEKWVEAFVKATDDNHSYLKDIALDNIKRVIDKWNKKILQEAADKYKDEHNKTVEEIGLLVKEGYIKKYRVADFFKFIEVIDKYYQKFSRNLENITKIVDESMVEGNDIPNNPYGGYYLIIPTKNQVTNSKPFFEYYNKLLRYIRNRIEIYKEKKGEYPPTIEDIDQRMKEIEEPMGGKWLYNPQTGEFKSSVFPEL